MGGFGLNESQTKRVGLQIVHFRDWHGECFIKVRRTPVGPVSPGPPSHQAAFPITYQRKPVAKATGFFFISVKQCLKRPFLLGRFAHRRLADGANPFRLFPGSGLTRLFVVLVCPQFPLHPTSFDQFLEATQSRPNGFPFMNTHPQSHLISLLRVHQTLL
jgi:hypothetical protein